MEKQTCKSFFVYGTLRPCIKADWSVQVHKNPQFKLKYYKARLHGCKLYHMPHLGYPTVQITKNKKDFVVGHILESDNFNKVKEVLDEIEDYPSEYHKLISTNCYNIEKDHYQSVYYYIFNEITDVDPDVNLEHINDEKFQLVESNDYEVFVNEGY